MTFLRTFLPIASAIFLLLGLLQAGYGPAVPVLAAGGLGVASAGLLGSLHFLGSAAGILASGVLVLRLGLSRAAGLGLGLMGLGLALVALPLLLDWPFALSLLGAAVAGFGLGALSAGLNVTAARLGEHSARTLNLINAFFGLGSVISPLLVGALAGAGVGLAFGLYGLLALTLLLPVRLLGTAPALTGEDAPARAGLLPVFALMFGLYVGLEAGLATWLTAHLDFAGYAGAAALTTGFWVSLTAGRFAAAALGGRVPAPRLLLACLGAGALLLLVALLTPYSAPALIALGFVIGPVFPTAFGWAAAHLPAARAPLVLAAGAVGGFLGSGALGLLAQNLGLGALLPGFLALAVLSLLAVLVVAGRTGRLGQAA